jgi:hypothetical protein
MDMIKKKKKKKKKRKKKKKVVLHIIPLFHLHHTSNLVLALLGRFPIWFCPEMELITMNFNPQTTHNKAAASSGT